MLLNSAIANTLDAFSFIDLYPANGTMKSVKTLRNTQVVRQQYDFNCAAASLATLLNYQYGEKYSERATTEGLKMMAKPERWAAIKRDGFSLFEVEKLSHKLGYTTVGYNFDSLDELSEVNFPSIVLVALNAIPHFVIVKQIKNGRVFLADPAWGNRSMTGYQFSKIWQRNFAFFVLPKNKTLDNLKLKNAFVIKTPAIEQTMDIEQISPNVWPQQGFDKFIVTTTPMVLSK